MSQRLSFRTPFGSQRYSGSKTALKSARQNFYPIVSSSRDILSWKVSLLVRSEILGLFVNTLTADYKYSCHNTENFLQQIQIALSRKPSFFSF